MSSMIKKKWSALLFCYISYFPAVIMNVVKNNCKFLNKYIQQNVLNSYVNSLALS